MTNFLKYVLPSMFVLVGLVDLLLGVLTNGSQGGIVGGIVVILIGIATFVVMPITTRR